MISYSSIDIWEIRTYANALDDAALSGAYQSMSQAYGIPL